MIHSHMAFDFCKLFSFYRTLERAEMHKTFHRHVFHYESDVDCSPNGDISACRQAPSFERPFHSSKSTGIKINESRLAEFALELETVCVFLWKAQIIWISLTDAYRLPDGSPSKMTTSFNLMRHQIEWTLIARIATVILTNNLAFSLTFVSTLIWWGKNKKEKEKDVSSVNFECEQLWLHFRTVPNSTLDNGMHCTDAASILASSIDRNSDLRQVWSRTLCQCNELFESFCHHWCHTWLNIRPTVQTSNQIELKLAKLR